MKYAELICALVMAIILLALYVRQSIIEHKLLKLKLILAFVCIAIPALGLGLYDLMKGKKIMEYCLDGATILVYVVVTLAYFKNITDATAKSHLESEFLKSLENDKIFILLDKKEKIKQISTNLARTAGVDKKDIIGKRFFTFLEENFVLMSLNDTQIKLSRVKEYFKVWSEECKEGDSCKREFLVSSKDGKETNVFNFNDTPIFTAGRYTGHLLLGDLDDEVSMLQSERKLQDKSRELTNLKARFASYLDVTDEAIFFYNLDEKYVWGNDSFVKTLNLNGNTVSRAELENYIHADDIAYYHKIISGLTEQSPCYDVKYRFKTGANYQFVHEVGKRIFSKGADSEITGTVEIVNDSHYAKTEVQVLDTIKDEAQMYADIENAYRRELPFEIAIFSLTNLPEINKAHGRSIGNMVLGEYVRAIKDKLVNDDKIYRISGLEFVILIEDGRKMTILKQLLERRVLTNSSLEYGSIKVEIEANFGVAFYSDCASSKDIIVAATRALNTSKLPQVDVNYMFYRDIK